MALLIIGFLSAIGGFVLLVMGGFNLPGRTRIPHLTARLAGVLFLLFFPLGMLANYLGTRFELHEQIEIVVVYWVLLSVCVLSASILLLHALTKTRPVGRAKMRTAGSKVQSPGATVAAAPVAKTSPTASKSAPSRKPKPSQPEPESGNPFDFS